MKAKPKLLLLFLALVLCLASSALAGPLSPPLAPLPVAGETTMCSFSAGCASTVRVDWIVNFGGGFFNYYYQVEGPADLTTHVEAFSVTTPPGGFVTTGVLLFDLDTDFIDPVGGPVTGHTAGPAYPNLGAPPPPAESEDAVGAPVSPTTFTLTSTSATWTFSTPVIGAGQESVVLFGRSLAPPVYGNAGAINSGPPSPWDTQFPGSTKIPVPSPEPMFNVLLGMGMAGILWMNRRRFVTMQ